MELYKGTKKIMKLKLGYLYLELYTVIELSNKGLYRRLSKKLQDRMLNKFLYHTLLAGHSELYENTQSKKLI